MKAFDWSSVTYRIFATGNVLVVVVGLLFLVPTAFSVGVGAVANDPAEFSFQILVLGNDPHQPVFPYSAHCWRHPSVPSQAIWRHHMQCRIRWRNLLFPCDRFLVGCLTRFQWCGGGNGRRKYGRFAAITLRLSCDRSRLPQPGSTEAHKGTRNRCDCFLTSRCSSPN